MSIKRIILALGLLTVVIGIAYVSIQGAVRTNDSLNLLDNEIVKVDKDKTQATQNLSNLQTNVETLKQQTIQAEQEKAAVLAELEAERGAQ